MPMWIDQNRRRDRASKAKLFQLPARNVDSKHSRTQPGRSETLTILKHPDNLLRK